MKDDFTEALPDNSGHYAGPDGFVTVTIEIDHREDAEVDSPSRSLLARMVKKMGGDPDSMVVTTHFRYGRTDQVEFLPLHCTATATAPLVDPFRPAGSSHGPHQDAD